jgi:hypothetical protein
VVPPEYGSFLVASTGASAALLGLLFVSVSIAPERVFGETAQPGRRALALSSFTALANAFFISLSGLIPHVSFALFVIIASGIALSQSLSLLLTARDWRRERRLLRSITMFVAATAVYGTELFIGVELYGNGADTGLITVLLQVLLAVFAIGLARAWELLGAPRVRGLASGAVGWFEGRFDTKPAPEAKKGSP